MFEHGCCIASLIQGFDVEVLGFVRIFAEKQPGEGVEEGGFAGAVVALDVGHVVKFNGELLNTLEVGEGELVEMDVHGGGNWGLGIGD